MARSAEPPSKHQKQTQLSFFKAPAKRPLVSERYDLLFSLLALLEVPSEDVLPRTEEITDRFAAAKSRRLKLKMVIFLFFCVAQNRTNVPGFSYFSHIIFTQALKWILRLVFYVR
jgi:hypothetical protein